MLAAYRTLANSLAYIVWNFDAQGRLEWLNNRWTELTGLTLEESLRDDGAFVAIHPDDIDALQATFSAALATSKPREIDYRIRNASGIYRFHAASFIPVSDDKGVITRWVAAMRDTHEQREANRRFEAIFHLNPQPTVVTRVSNGTFVDVNTAYLKMTGFSRAEVLGKSAAELGIWNPEQRAPVVAKLHAGAGEIEIPIRTKDGRPLTLQLVAARIEFDGEECFVNVMSDVTERRKTDEALRRSEALARAQADDLAALMDAVPAAVLISHDAECRTLSGNRVGRDVLRLGDGESASMSTGSNHYKVFVDDVEALPDDLPLQRASRGIEVRNYEETVRFDDGQVTHLYGSAVPLRDPNGVPRGAIAAFVDVTRLKQAEAAMREADRRKDEFLALLSHELRNPLAPIITAAQLLQLRGDAETAYELEVILRQAHHLIRLVDDLLDVARVARGKVTLEKTPLEIATVVAKAIEATEPLLEQRRHQLHVSVPPEGLVVEADEVRLTQVVNNLLTNAARYTPADGRVDVSAAREDDHIVLRVRDNGIGIAPTLLPNIFEMFVQGERGSNREEGGLGLGLSLVRTLTTLHGGTVSAWSAGVGEGSEFAVRLPAAVSTVMARRAAPRPPAIGGLRILVVDDNVDAASLIASLLINVGHQLQVAHDPSQALALAQEFNPQIAIVDIGLPVMDGYALGRELRLRLGEAVTLVALTGYGHVRDRQRSEEAGFAAHLVKPIDADKLIEALATLQATHVDE